MKTTLRQWALLPVLLFTVLTAQAQWWWNPYGQNAHNSYYDNQRSYGVIYSKNLKGDFDLIGNTLLRSTTESDMNRTDLANNRKMVYVDADNSYATRNSSRATLNLPAGSTIAFARIYWGGMVDKRDYDKINIKKVKVRKNNDAYQQYTALRVNTHPNDADNNQIEYQAYIDVTSWLSNMGSNANGDYWVADIMATPGNYPSGSGAYGGWLMVVVYEKNNLPYKSVRLYDGYNNVYDGGDATITSIQLTGLNVPSGNPASRMGVVVWEGDAGFTGDYVKLNGNKLSDNTNPISNIWNGSITRNGRRISSKYPDYVNQMSVDIDQFDVSNYVLSGATTANIECRTTGDSYYPGIFAFSSDFKDPAITIDKAVKNTNGQSTIANKNILTYTLTGSNTGKGNATNCMVIDTLPASVILENNSFKIKNGNSWLTCSNVAQAEHNGRTYVKFFVGKGATNAKGGTLEPGRSFSLSFNVKVVADEEAITNLVHFYAASDARENFVNEATATINPAATDDNALPVLLSDFSAGKQGATALLKWTTATEINSSHFEIERSLNGVHFVKAGRVAAKGMTHSSSQYQFTDALTGISATVIYYRLNMVDIDGSQVHSPVVPVRLDEPVTAVNFTVYPNPFATYFKADITSSQPAVAMLRITNTAGQQIVNRNLSLQSGKNTVSVDDLSGWQPGIYLIELTAGDSHYSQKIIRK